MQLKTLKNHPYAHEDDMKHFCSLLHFPALYIHYGTTKRTSELKMRFFTAQLAEKDIPLWNATFCLAIPSKRVTLLFTHRVLPHGMWPASWPFSILKISTCTPFFFFPPSLNKVPDVPKLLESFWPSSGELISYKCTAADNIASTKNEIASSAISPTSVETHSSCYNDQLSQLHQCFPYQEIASANIIFQSDYLIHAFTSILHETEFLHKIHSSKNFCS